MSQDEIVNLKNEVWKDVVGYEGLYLISNMGRIISTGKKRLYAKSRKHKRKLLHPFYDKLGYARLMLCGEDGSKKRWYVHKLVALAFLENPNNYTDVNHIDEDKTNNCAKNLKWISHRDNCNYGNRNKNIRKKVKTSIINKQKIINIDTGEIFNDIHEFGRKIGMNLSNYHEYRKSQ